jgi:glycosyltransferase involved in cell wall biosynthesis
MVTENKLLTVCIFTYGQSPNLLQTLQRLTNQSALSNSFDVVIVDNTIKQSSTFSKKIENFVSGKKNIKYTLQKTDGLSGARNYCLNNTNTKFVHFIDDDVLVGFNFVHNLLARLCKNETLQVIGGKVVSNWSLVTRPSWLKDENLGYLSMVDFGDQVLKLGQRNGMWFAGANICFNREDVLSVGGFCEKLGRKGWSNTLMGSEEMDVVFKLNQEKIIYDPSFAVEHIVDPKRSSPSWFIKRAAWQAVSDVMTDNLYMKETGTWSDFQLPTKFIENNINVLFKKIDDKNNLSKKLKTTQLLVFLALTGYLK